MYVTKKRTFPERNQKALEVFGRGRTKGRGKGYGKTIGKAAEKGTVKTSEKPRKES